MDSPSSDNDPGPRIHRPVPRRPFNLNFANATPPDDDSVPNTPQISASDLRFLDPRFQQLQQQRSPNSGDDDSTLTRAASLMNLTASTLSGIYAPSTPGRLPDDTTPWGPGSETPAVGVDDPTTNLRPMHDRSSPPAPSRTLPRALRAALLFVLGIGYGLLLTRLPNRQQPSPDWRYLAVWGLAGVGLGSLLPWFDRVWEDTFGKNEPPRTPRRLLQQRRRGSEGGGPEADWALVVRGIGAFVGIVFAIRRLPWTSTMQASLTLALANPFLWYLIDRSKTGFLLSAAVGVAGGLVLMGGGLDVMPAPGVLRAAGRGTNGTAVPAEMGGAQWAGMGLETVGTGVWVVSVLFCSCVCFGNIGRRLALNGEAAGRGRWGGVR